MHRIKPTTLPPVAGMAVPAFIRNGDYYFTEVDVFADGLFECWGAVDVDFLARKFAERWISPGVPVGCRMSVHDLMSGKVTSSDWIHTAESFHERLQGYLESLNPKHENLHDFGGEDVEVRDGVRWSKIGFMDGSPVQYSKSNNSPQGESRYAIIRQEGQFFLSTIRIYADGQIDVHPRFDEQRLVRIDEFKEMLDRQEICVSVPDGTSIEIDSLGQVTVTDVVSWLDKPAELLLEVQETVKKLNGEKDAIEKCREAFQVYLEKPTLKTKDLLRAAYEAVPEL
ncbi:MAG: hypothetical protein KDA89_22980, partial [Planctomycetaceae bacterium]|nr:hypothetical protein [Planctomycetaceae bacterium]